MCAWGIVGGIIDFDNETKVKHVLYALWMYGFHKTPQFFKICKV
jgi:hypothetical protein